MRPLLLLALAATAAAAGCTAEGVYADATVATGGDPARGRAVIREFGCGACHTIPGVRGARGLVGPPLTAFARRTYVAGRLPNTPA
ncbi:MAG TPA: cytochrome C1, partial [Methylomirabilota bacterium]